jgi:hypothetical protein
MTSSAPSTLALPRRTFLASALALFGGAAHATNGVFRADIVELSVVDRDTGEVLPVIRYGGRLFVAGQTGARYGLRLTNRSVARVLAVLSADGVNVLDGETASYSQSGYVFGPRQSYDVTGWRKSDTEVAAFTFAPLPQSYAARTGRPNDVGVIGMAVFEERPPIELLGAERRAAPAPTSVPAPAPAPPPSAATSEVVVTGSRIARRDFGAQRQDDRLGTAHGAREWSQVTTVSFVRATPYPCLTRQIEYDTFDNLVARGVIAPGRGGEPRPRAFPSQPHGGGYVPDPPGGG